MHTHIPAYLDQRNSALMFTIWTHLTPIYLRHILTEHIKQMGYRVS